MYCIESSKQGYTQVAIRQHDILKRSKLLQLPSAGFEDLTHSHHIVLFTSLADKTHFRKDWLDMALSKTEALKASEA